MPQVEINENEIWVLINHHLENEERDAKKRDYPDASDEKARATYLRSLVTPNPFTIGGIWMSDFRKQLEWQLRQLSCGNAEVEGSVSFIMDLIGRSRVEGINVELAEEVSRLRLENGHLQYTNS